MDLMKAAHRRTTTRARKTTAARAGLARIDAWTVAEDGCHPELTEYHGTIFALANGRLGARGVPEEASGDGPDHLPDCYAAGVYACFPASHEWPRARFAGKCDRMVAILDWLGLRFAVDDQPLDLAIGKVRDYARTLDLRRGVLSRTFVWIDPRGRDDTLNIGARALSGPDHNGHYFWDTEAYMVPYYVWQAPEKARALLVHRHRKLPQAKARAQEHGYRGAMYPWSTSDGEESAQPWEYSELQVHVTAAIPYAVWHYVEATDDFDFYDPKTIHESSLGACIHAIIANAIGKEKEAFDFYLRGARLDLDQPWTRGIRIANAAGAWQVLVNGFAGLRLSTADGSLSFAPHLPRGWNALAFSLHLRGRLLRVRVTRELLTLSCEGAPFPVRVDGRKVTVRGMLAVSYAGKGSGRQEHE